VRKISWLEVDFKFPPGPTGAGFNVNTIRQVNQDIQNIQDALSELLDLPEAKKLMAYVIPNPPDTSWKSLETIYCQYFEPLKNLYRALKKEVLEIET